MPASHMLVVALALVVSQMVFAEVMCTMAFSIDTTTPNEAHNVTFFGSVVLESGASTVTPLAVIHGKDATSPIFINATRVALSSVHRENGKKLETAVYDTVTGELIENILLSRQRPGQLYFNEVEDMVALPGGVWCVTLTAENSDNFFSAEVHCNASGRFAPLRGSDASGFGSVRLARGNGGNILTMLMTNFSGYTSTPSPTSQLVTEDANGKHSRTVPIYDMQNVGYSPFIHVDVATDKVQFLSVGYVFPPTSTNSGSGGGGGSGSGGGERAAGAGDEGSPFEAWSRARMTDEGVQDNEGAGASSTTTPQSSGESGSGSQSSGGSYSSSFQPTFSGSHQSSFTGTPSGVSGSGSTAPTTAYSISSHTTVNGHNTIQLFNVDMMVGKARRKGKFISMRNQLGINDAMSDGENWYILSTNYGKMTFYVSVLAVNGTDFHSYGPFSFTQSSSVDAPLIPSQLWCSP